MLQARDVTLIAPGRYRLTTLLRGQRATEHAIGNPAPAGARVVVLDGAVTELPFTAGEICLPWNLAVGPANRPVSDLTLKVSTDGTAWLDAIIWMIRAITPPAAEQQSRHPSDQPRKHRAAIRSSAQ